MHTTLQPEKLIMNTISEAKRRSNAWMKFLTRLSALGMIA